MPDYLANLLRRPPVGWWDILDIAVVSVLIYEFLKLIRGTRAVQMAVGSLLVIGLFYMSQLAPLPGNVQPGISPLWPSRRSSSSVRHPEALAHFGQAPFFGKLPPGGSRRDGRGSGGRDHLLSKEIGAIIAISARSGCATTSREFRSTRRSDLLVTIFRPGSPLQTAP
jgi:diadenylate cyclase